MSHSHHHPKFKSLESRQKIVKQLHTFQRYEIKPTTKSHQFLVGASKAAPAHTKPISSEEKQMLGHLAESQSGPQPVPRQSSVILPLCTDNGIPSLLFIKRSSKFGSHRGQVAFPGGMFEPQDQFDPIRCAVREMGEEIGLTHTDITIFGLHHDAGTSDKSRNISTGQVKSTIITPVIAMIEKDIQSVDFRLSRDEVDYCFTVPLTDMLDLQTAWAPYKGRPSYLHNHRKKGLNNLFPHDCQVNKTADFQYIYHHNGVSTMDVQKQQNAILVPEEIKKHVGNVQTQKPPLINDGLSIAQLQYLAAFKTEEECDRFFEMSEPTQEPPVQHPEPQCALQIIHVPDHELIWGATAHITHLFLKQVLVPISDEIFDPQNIRI